MSPFFTAKCACYMFERIPVVSYSFESYDDGIWVSKPLNFREKVTKGFSGKAELLSIRMTRVWSWFLN